MVNVLAYNKRVKIKIRRFSKVLINAARTFGAVSCAFWILQFGILNLKFEILWGHAPSITHCLAHGSRFSLQVLAPRASHHCCGLSVAIAHADWVLVDIVFLLENIYLGNDSLPHRITIDRLAHLESEA
jgi:hypothetical protein